MIQKFYFTPNSELPNITIFVYKYTESSNFENFNSFFVSISK